MTSSEAELEYDPIIAFYLKISQSNEADVFSETMLRLSFKEVFGPTRPITSDELSLYRKLLLLYYSKNYTSTTDLSAIMTCYDESVILFSLRNRERILMSWHHFYNETLSSIVFRESSHQMLSEYTIRYINLFGHITKDQIKMKAGDIRKFLGCQLHVSRHFLNSFNSILKNKLQQAQSQNHDKWTEDDLKLKNIYHSIKHKLNYFVRREMSEVEFTSEDEEPQIKKPIETESYVANTSIESTQPNVNWFSYKEDEIKSNYFARKAMSDVISDDEEPQSKKPMKTKFTVISTSIEVIQPHVYESESLEDEKQTSNNESNKFYAYDDIDDEISYIEVNDEEDIKHENNEEQSQEIFQQFDETSIEANGHAYVIDEVSDHTGNADNNEESEHVVDYNTAIEYVAALQAYAVVNEHSEAIELLNSVDSIFRKKSYEELFSYFI